MLGDFMRNPHLFSFSVEFLYVSLLPIYNSNSVSNNRQEPSSCIIASITLLFFLLLFLHSTLLITFFSLSPDTLYFSFASSLHILFHLPSTFPNTFTTILSQLILLFARFVFQFLASFKSFSLLRINITRFSIPNSIPTPLEKCKQWETFQAASYF